MFSILLVVGAVIGVARMAEADRGEGFKWGAITFGLCVLFSFIPLPSPLSILLAIVVAFVWMTLGKKTFY